MSKIARLSQISLVVFACLMALLFVSQSALAAGRVQWKSTSFKERKESKSWRLELAIYLPRPPDSAYVPMKFEFQPVAYYERSMVDGDKLIERTVPLQHNQPIIESVDVGFLDPGTAKTMSRTKFTFKVTRAHDYAAGEYKVTVTDSRTGRKIGQPTTLKFLGENKVIDRRSVVFTGKEKKKKEEEPEEGSSEDGSSEAGDASNDDMDTEDAELVDLDDEGDEPPAVEEKPGGCGCSAPGAGSGGTTLLPLLLLVGGLIIGARHRRAG